jgi:hypothetical protein
MPNLNKLLKNECEKRLQRGIDTNLLPINEHQFEVKVDTDVQNIWKRFNKIISNRKLLYEILFQSINKPASVIPVDIDGTGPNRSDRTGRRYGLHLCL